MFKKIAVHQISSSLFNSNTIMAVAFIIFPLFFHLKPNKYFTLGDEAVHIAQPNAIEEV